MPTTQPLDEDELGDIAEGPLKPIAAFAEPLSAPAPQQPRPTPVTATTGMRTPQPQHRMPDSGVTISTPKGTIRIPGLKTPRGTAADRTVPRPRTNDPGHSLHNTTTVRDSEYTEADVHKAWNTFIADNGSEHLLTNAMRMVSPMSVGPDTFRLAQSAVHLKYISENLERLTDFVRSAVRNSRVRFVLEEVSEDSPLAWNDRELLGHIIENNPALSGFIEGLDLKLM